MVEDNQPKKGRTPKRSTEGEGGMRPEEEKELARWMGSIDATLSSINDKIANMDEYWKEALKNQEEKVHENTRRIGLTEGGIAQISALIKEIHTEKQKKNGGVWEKLVWTGVGIAISIALWFFTSVLPEIYKNLGAHQ